jgi:hypothetical protein
LKLDSIFSSPIVIPTQEKNSQAPFHRAAFFAANTLSASVFMEAGQTYYKWFATKSLPLAYKQGCIDV